MGGAGDGGRKGLVRAVDRIDDGLDVGVDRRGPLATLGRRIEGHEIRSEAGNRRCDERPSEIDLRDHEARARENRATRAVRARARQRVVAELVHDQGIDADAGLVLGNVWR